MAVHVLRRTHTLPLSAAECWAFFADPRNLARITPESLNLCPVGDLPDEMYAGQMLVYRIFPFPRLPMTWVTEITHVEPPHFFVDEQRMGPYRLWHHEHRFLPAAAGRTVVHDVVHYALPFGPLGDLVAHAAVRSQLEQIFDYRQEKIAALFPK